MTDRDKVRNKTEELKGEFKESAGEATRDRDLEAEGRKDQSKANWKQAGEEIKDAVKRA